jgi:hypothetical protein
MDAPDSIGFRLLNRPKHIVTRLDEDERIITTTPAAKWILFVMQSDADIHGALNWLALAYREAHKSE